MRKKPKFEIKDLLGLGMVLVVLVISISYGLLITTEVKEDTCDHTYDEGDCRGCSESSLWNYNASNNNCYNITNATQTTTYISIREGAFNATGDGIKAVAKIPTKLPMIVTIVLAALIIGLLIKYLYVRVAE